MYGDIKGVVEIREGDSRLPNYREQASRQADRPEVDNRKEDSRVLDIMEVDSRKEGSRGVDCREVKGPRADPHLRSGASFRTGVTEEKPVNSSIMIRVFSREARVKPNSRQKYKCGWDNLYFIPNQKK